MTADFRLCIPDDIFRAMLDHIRSALPAEGCGLLAGTIANGRGEVTLFLPLVNALNSPTEFESEPRSMLSANRAMRAHGVKELAVYHSHPTSAPIPSRRDLARNYSEAVMNVIVGFPGKAAEVRAWWLSKDGAREAEWGVEGQFPEEADA